MSKRSPGWVRAPRDHYDTPSRAVTPALSWWGGGLSTFAEPCVGNGCLKQAVEGLSHLKCVYQGDIATGQDALKWTNPENADCIVTNPPWSRDLLHPMIDHFVGLKKPVWLLFDSDWAHTRQAIPYLKHCSMIISVGRLKWIAGTKHVGFDNASWYAFVHSDEETYPLFIPRL